MQGLKRNLNTSPLFSSKHHPGGSESSPFHGSAAKATLELSPHQGWPVFCGAWNTALSRLLDLTQIKLSHLSSLLTLFLVTLLYRWGNKGIRKEGQLLRRTVALGNHP